MQAKKMKFLFTFENIYQYFRQALAEGYEVIPCHQYLKYKVNGSTHKILVNRIDIDVSVKKAKRLCDIFNSLNIPATFFVRLHANEYNPFAFENYRILKYIKESGHEIGYHSEVYDEAVIWQEDMSDCLRRDLNVLQTMLDIKIFGTASHGGMTGLNNLDFWQDKNPADFGLEYEAYDQSTQFGLFNNSLYISDSSWTYWKCYLNGQLVTDDRRTLGEHVTQHHPVIYSLIHPETYYDDHFYE